MEASRCAVSTCDMQEWSSGDSRLGFSIFLNLYLCVCVCVCVCVFFFGFFGGGGRGGGEGSGVLGVGGVVGFWGPKGRRGV